jgi:hypothetical protein
MSQLLILPKQIITVIQRFLCMENNKAYDSLDFINVGKVFIWRQVKARHTLNRKHRKDILIWLKILLRSRTVKMIKNYALQSILSIDRTLKLLLNTWNIYLHEHILIT